jgi:hypothetical protein
MNSTNSYPIFVDGQKIGEATSVSYTIKKPVEYKGIDHPGHTVVERDPPEFEVKADLPVDDLYAPIDHESHVEFAIPPSDHDESGWRVLEVWEIHQYEIMNGYIELAAWQGEITDEVDYLGFDTDAIVEGEKRVEPEPGIDLRIDTKHESDEANTVLDDSDDKGKSEDGGFEADVHDI